MELNVVKINAEELILMGSHINSSRTISEDGFTDAFSTLNLLRSYNSLIAPNSESRRYNSYPRSSDYSPIRGPETTSSSTMLNTPLSPLAPTSAPFSLSGLLQPPLLAAVPPLLPPVNLSHPFANATAAAMSRNIIENAVMSSMHQSRRARSEKKPIPDEQKDDKYYERRKRNNQAAKKSRDARKIREDHIALRATMLEHENAILRAQVLALREECQSLRQMLIKQRMPSMQSLDQLTAESRSTGTGAASVNALTPPNVITSLACQV